MTPTSTFQCKDIMTEDPVCCLPSDTASKCAQTMRDQDVGPVPIVESHASKKLVGILTDRDLALKIVAEGRNPNSTKIEEIMTRDPITCLPHDDIESALDTMQTHQVRRVPIVDEEGIVVGIIAQADIAIRMEEPEKISEVVVEISQPRTMVG
ncbi:MAG: CBS domain-containing protein [Bryobacteraceae bacterium]